MWQAADLMLYGAVWVGIMYAAIFGLPEIVRFARSLLC